jgi:hypothetical protein
MDILAPSRTVSHPRGTRGRAFASKRHRDITGDSMSVVQWFPTRVRHSHLLPHLPFLIASLKKNANRIRKRKKGKNRRKRRDTGPICMPRKTAPATTGDTS